MLLSVVLSLGFVLFASPHASYAKDVTQGVDAKDKVIKVGACT
jgi:hypothetical protein